MLPRDVDFTVCVCFLHSRLQLAQYVTCFRPLLYDYRDAEDEMKARGLQTCLIQRVASKNTTYKAAALWDVVIGTTPNTCTVVLPYSSSLPVFAHSNLQTWAVERTAQSDKGKFQTIADVRDTQGHGQLSHAWCPSQC